MAYCKPPKERTIWLRQGGHWSEIATNGSWIAADKYTTLGITKRWSREIGCFLLHQQGWPSSHDAAGNLIFDEIHRVAHPLQPIHRT